MTKFLDGLASGVIILLVCAFLAVVVWMVGWLFWIAIVEQELFAIAGSGFLLTLTVVVWAFNPLTKKEMRKNGHLGGHWID